MASTVFHRSLVFNALNQLGWTVDVDQFDDMIPEIAAICDEDKRIIWVNKTSTIDDQINGALYLKLWPDAIRFDLRPESPRHWLFDNRMEIVNVMLTGIYAGAIAAKQKVR